MRKFNPGDRVRWIEGKETKYGRVRENSEHAKQLEAQAIHKARPELRANGSAVEHSSPVIRIEDSDSGRLIRKWEHEINSCD